MSFVLDASVTIVWAMRDEEHFVADATRLRLKSEEAFVPSIWWYEVQNILLVNERRKRISEGDSIRFLEQLRELPILVDRLPDHERTFEMARRYGLTFYDAAYLEVAYRNNLPLATLDKALKAAAEAAGIPVLA